MLNSSIDEIKSRLDIVDLIQGYIRLQKAGANYRAVCPFHSEKKPSFFVSPARQIFKCFGCNAGGNMFEFVMKMEGVEFGDALKILAQKAGVELKRQDPQLQTERQRLLEICESACKFYENKLENSENGKKAKEYLLGRGISEESIKTWRVGFSPDAWRELLGFLQNRGYKSDEIEKAGLVIKSATNNQQPGTSNYYDRFRGRIIFPIFDLNSQIIGFGGRIFGEHKRPDGQEEAKYINSPQTLIYDKSRVLYGLHRGKVEIRKKGEVILVEGYTDVIMSHQAGAENVVATSGTSLTPWQLKILRRYCDNLLTCFDMDIAGDSATKRGIDLAMNQEFNVKVVTLPQGLDPADVIKDQRDEWQKAISSPKGIIDFYFENAFSKFDAKTIDGKKEIAKILLPVLKKIPSRIEQSHWIAILADRFGVKEADIVEDMNKIKTEPDYYSEDSSQDNSLPAPYQKSRKDLLEERFISLLIKKPEHLARVNDIAISNPTLTAIFQKLGEGGDLSISGGSLPSRDNPEPALASFRDNLILQEELDGTEEELDFPREIKVCYYELKILKLKEKLGDLEKIIRGSKFSDDANDNILREFNELYRELNSLEKQKVISASSH